MTNPIAPVGFQRIPDVTPQQIIDNSPLVELSGNPAEMSLRQYMSYTFAALQANHPEITDAEVRIALDNMIACTNAHITERYVPKVEVLEARIAQTRRIQQHERDCWKKPRMQDYFKVEIEMLQAQKQEAQQ